LTPACCCCRPYSKSDLARLIRTALEQSTDGTG
jgi:hypothetical protein